MLQVQLSQNGVDGPRRSCVLPKTGDILDPNGSQWIHTWSQLNPPPDTQESNLPVVNQVKTQNRGVCDPNVPIATQRLDNRAWHTPRNVLQLITNTHSNGTHPKSSTLSNQTHPTASSLSNETNLTSTLHNKIKIATNTRSNGTQITNALSNWNHITTSTLSNETHIATNALSNGTKFCQAARQPVGMTHDKPAHGDKSSVKSIDDQNKENESSDATDEALGNLTEESHSISKVKEGKRKPRTCISENQIPQQCRCKRVVSNTSYTQPSGDTVEVRRRCPSGSRNITVNQKTGYKILVERTDRGYVNVFGKQPSGYTDIVSTEPPPRRTSFSNARIPSY
ncbi:hypothetical protein ElyMa_000644000 [Elysia marginata]|uniref:SH3 domain-containing protein n=1 Tax=Elysia marginata TaxID=1093978 RepID=A0AAV4GC96_9GAST|nr:hypothetical protein ElyMa_000644000 [Elysia marginata]